MVFGFRKTETAVVGPEIEEEDTQGDTECNVARAAVK
jgi:hypothetical protein